VKFLVGIISGIVVTVAVAAGAAVASSTTSSSSAVSLAPQSSLMQQSSLTQQTATHQTVATRLGGLTGELSRKDTGAFELKVTLRQNGVFVERDVRLLVAHAKVTNRLGRLVRLPLDDATARVSGRMLPHSAWRQDDDGQLLPTFAANRIILLTATPIERTNQAEDQDTPDTEDTESD
jgi:hypothetical protein